MVALLGAAMVATGLTSCGHHDAPPWDHLSWRAVRLPVPAGDRALVRGATWCADRWVVVGATADARGSTKPAVWASGDGRQWRTLPLDPDGDFYAARAILTSVGCADGRLAVLGAKSGGAHGNPRTATWRQLPDGTLAAVRAPFELYGGRERGRGQPPGRRAGRLPDRGHPGQWRGGLELTRRATGSGSMRVRRGWRAPRS